MIHRLSCAVCLLGGTLLTAPTAFAQTASTEQPQGRTHQVKIGVRDGGYHGPMPTVAYEWLIAPRLSVEAGAGFTTRSYSFGWEYIDDYSGNIIRTSIEDRSNHAVAFGQARYYLQSNKAPMIGWYAGLGLQSSYSYYRRTFTEGGSGSQTYSRFSVQPQLRLGRQWALGKRLALDSYAGLDYFIPRRTAYSQGLRNLKVNVGFQLGYRF